MIATVRSFDLTSFDHRLEGHWGFACIVQTLARVAPKVGAV